MLITSFLYKIEERLQDLVDERTRELRESQKSLVESEKMVSIGALVAGVSHELNTPIGVALTASSYIVDNTHQITDIISQEKVKKAELIRYLNQNLQSGEIAVSSLKRAAELVQNFKQLAVDQKSEEKRDLNLHELLDTIAKSLRNSKKDLNLEIINKIDRELFLFSYAGDFIMIFTNLIQNSIYHGFEGCKDGIIEVISVIKGEELIINFKDNGIGIPKKDLGRVFEPFFTTKRHKGGTGLGLSIIYNMVTKLGGSISVNSQETGLEIKIAFNINALM